MQPLNDVSGKLKPYLHDVEEVVVDLGLVSKLELDLIEVGEGVLHLEPLEAGGLRAAGDPLGPQT